MHNTTSLLIVCVPDPTMQERRCLEPSFVVVDRVVGLPFIDAEHAVHSACVKSP